MVHDHAVVALDLIGVATLEADRLFRFFHVNDQEIVALADVSLDVDDGEVVAIVGPSGSGKSTLLACLAGLDDPDGGTVRVAGQRISRRTEAARAALRARHVGVLWQAHNLFAHLNVVENVTLAQRLAGRGDRRRARALIERLGVADRAHALPATLSGGEAVRAGLAVALANDPAVILADEPTGELDSASAATVASLLRSEADRGHAVVVVTHSDALAGAADQVLRIVDGRIAP